MKERKTWLLDEAGPIYIPCPDAAWFDPHLICATCGAVVTRRGCEHAEDCRWHGDVAAGGDTAR